MPFTVLPQRRDLYFVSIVATLVTGLSQGMAFAQSVPSLPTSDRAELSRGAGTVVPPDYVIGEDDVLSVVFWKEPEFSLQVRVRPDGQITLPLLRDVPAAGFTPEQLRQRLEAAAKPFLAEANATVIVTETNSRRVFVTGEVAHPGAFPMNGPMTVLQALALAGGFTEFAHREHIDVFRTVPGQSGRVTFNYKDALRGKGAVVPLKPGDTVVVR